MFQTKVAKEIKNTHFVFENFSPKILPFVGECGKNMVEPDRLHMTM